MSKIRVLAVSVLVLGAATYAYACGDQKTTTASAGGSCCAKKQTEASAASTAGGECTAAKTQATAASAGEMSPECQAHMKAAAMGSCATGSANCTYGKNTVAISGACPTSHNADYAISVGSASCQGAGAECAKAIKAMPGVAAVTVDYANHLAYVCTDGSVCDGNALLSCLKKAGFKDAKLADMGRKYCSKAHGQAMKV